MNTRAFQKELLQNNEQMRLLISSLPSGLMIIDRNTQEILEVNRAVCLMTGMSQDEIIGQNCRNVICGAQKGQCAAKQLIETQESQTTVQCDLRASDGAKIPIVKTMTVVELGGRSCVVESIVDISEQKKVENRLRVEHERAAQLAKDASEANQTKSEFLANISHELRTPLNGVVGMAGLLKETPLTEDQECYADTMFVCAESLLKLVNGVLDYSNLEAGHIELSVRQFSPRHLLGSVVEQVKASLKTKPLEFSVDIPETLDQKLWGDPGRLQQVLMILIDNAIKFTPRGGLSIRVETEKHTPGAVKLLFAVKDSGIGIPKEKHNYIFERFTQVDSSTTRKYGGTGLGLATAKKIVHLMNGHIGVRSPKDGGSEFWFDVTLPIEEKQSKDNGVANNRLLIVDDSKTNREVMSQLLQKMHYQCDTAGSGEEAITLISENAYSMVFMDIQMPEMDGFATTKAIRSGLAGEENEHIPIVALSADDLEDDARWRNVGMTYCMLKPVSPEVLFQFLKSCSPEKNLSVRENVPVKPYPNLGERPVFDRQKLLSRLMGDGEILNTVLKGFISDIPGQIENLAQLVEDGELAGARVRAHGIKGASATVCAERMSAQCLKMEQQAELGDSEGLAIGLIELRTLFNELKEETEKSLQ